MNRESKNSLKNWNKSISRKFAEKLRLPVLMLLIVAMFSAGCGNPTSGADHKTDDVIAGQDKQIKDESTGGESDQSDKPVDSDVLDPGTSDLPEPSTSDPGTSDPVDSEPSNSDQDQTGSSKTEDGSDPSENEGTDPEIDEGELNEYGVPEGLMQQLYSCVKESVLTGYIEPNGISPEEFEWPNSDDDMGSRSWAYLDTMYGNYLNSKIKYDDSYFNFQMPDESMCQLMKSVFDRMVEWEATVPKKIYKVNVRFSPYGQLFSENIDFGN